MNNVNKTLYIPLYGKAYVSRKGIILHELHGMEKNVFRWVYAGGIAKKMYRLYEYRGGQQP